MPRTPSPRRPRAVRTPKIELFLDKINQEEIRDVRPAADCDFYASWKKTCCILDFSMPQPGEEVVNPVRGLLLRKEPEGGMMWNPKTGAVYRLNEAAYHAILDVEHGLSELEVARRNGLPVRSVQSMVRKLRELA